MRKNRVKQILYLWLIGIIFGCSSPEFLVEEQTNKNIKVSVLRKPEIEAKKFLFTKISKMNQNLLASNIQNKTVTSSIYNFSIDTNICKMVEINGITTYTFAVTREQSNNLFENLILKENSDGSYLAKLYQYNVTETEKNQILNGIDVNMTNKITVIEINDSDFVSNVFGKIYYSGSLCYQADIVVVPVTPCANGHTDPLQCELTGSAAPQPGGTQVVYIPVDCGSGSGGGPVDDGGFDGGGTSPTGGGPPEFGASEDTTPCQELKKMTDNNANKASLENLKTKTQGTKEFGFAIKKSTTGNGFAAPEPMILNPKNDKAIKMEPYSTGQYIIIMHNHPNPSIGPPMFSGADVVVLADLTQNGYNYNTNNSLPHNNSEYTITLAGFDAASNTSITFAIKIKDIVKFNASLAGEDKRNIFKKLISSSYISLTKNGITDPLDFGSDPRPATLHDFKDAFLKIIKNNNMGLGLYQAVPGVNNNVNWSEVVYNSSQNTSSLVPCVN